MAQADLPAFHIRPVGDDRVSPQHRKLVRLAIDNVLLEFVHQGALPDIVGLMQHCLIQIDFLLVVIISVILSEDRA